MAALVLLLVLPLPDHHWFQSGSDGGGLGEGQADGGILLDDVLYELPYHRVQFFLAAGDGTDNFELSAVVVIGQLLQILPVCFFEVVLPHQVLLVQQHQARLLLAALLRCQFQILLQLLHVLLHRTLRTYYDDAAVGLLVVLSGDVLVLFLAGCVPELHVDVGAGDVEAMGDEIDGHGGGVGQELTFFELVEQTGFAHCQVAQHDDLVLHQINGGEIYLLVEGRDAVEKKGHISDGIGREVVFGWEAVMVRVGESVGCVCESRLNCRKVQPVLNYKHLLQRVMQCVCSSKQWSGFERGQSFLYLPQFVFRPSLLSQSSSNPITAHSSHQLPLSLFFSPTTATLAASLTTKNNLIKSGASPYKEVAPHHPYKMINKIQNRPRSVSLLALLLLLLVQMGEAAQLSQHWEVGEGMGVELVRLEAFQMVEAGEGVIRYLYRRSFAQPLPTAPTVCLAVRDMSSTGGLMGGWHIYLSRVGTELVEVGLSLQQGHSLVRFHLSQLTLSLPELSAFLQVELASVSMGPYKQTRGAHIAIEKQIQLKSQQLTPQSKDSSDLKQLQVAVFLTGVPFPTVSQGGALRVQLLPLLTGVDRLLLVFEVSQLSPALAFLPGFQLYHAQVIIVHRREAIRRNLVYQTERLQIGEAEGRINQHAGWEVMVGMSGYSLGQTGKGGEGTMQTVFFRRWECEGEMFDVIKEQCSPFCPSGSYQFQQICQPCHPTCATCSSSSSSACLSCSSPAFTLLNGQCVCSLANQKDCLLCDSLLPGCSTCTSSPRPICLSCIEGYSKRGEGCVSCGSGCLRCEQECLQCAEGYQLLDGECRVRLLESFDCKNDPDVPHAATCEYSSDKKVIKSCEAGYYVSANKTACLACISVFCATCDSSGCTSCYDGTIKGTPKLCVCGTDKTFSALPNPRCQGCPSIVKDCKNCGLNIYKNQSVCLECDSGRSLSPDNMTCIQCPSGCTACVSTTNCTVCASNITTSVGGVCVCNNAVGYFTAANGSCVTCPTLLTGCSTCIYISTVLSCANCSAGYLLNSSNVCAVCPFKCLTCNGTTCLTCASGFVLTGTLCACPAGSFLNTTTNTCTLCSIAVSGCSLCVYSGGVVCSDCSVGLFPSATNATCITCPAQCSDCVTAAVCLSCVAPFMFVSPSCVCNSAAGSDLYLSTTATACVVCSSAIAHCLTCNDNGAAATTCADCELGFFPSGSACAACPMGCNDCVSLTNCTCEAGYDWNLTSFACECQTACQACSNATNGCAFCPGGNCTSCQAGFFLVAGPACQACSGVCLECETLATNCVICTAGYTSIGGGQCICEVGSGLYYDAALSSCVVCNASILNCSSCSRVNGSLATVCVGCQTGSYLADAITCTLCPPTCSSCTAPSACTLCVSGFSLQNGSCECANSLGFFYDAAVTHTCVLCSDLVPNCVTCANLTLTSYACVTCVGGMYPSQSVLCSPCPSSCGSCLNASFCLTCPSTFMPVPVNGVCVCDNSSGLYLDSTLMICDLCSNLINYCTSCGYNGSVLICLDCLPETYPSGSSCLFCEPFCFHCGNATSCATCDPGYELDAFGVLCICGSSCANCSSLVSSCSQCDPSGCLACAPGYYLLSSTTCQMCPAECVDCNSYSVCTLCQPTFTLTGSQCLCDASQGLFLFSGSCVQCSLLFSGCLTCTTVPSLQCLTCDAGFYKDASGDCLLCDSSCFSCSGATASSCTGCPLGMVLNGTVCECDAQCQSCSSSSANCVSCSYNVSVFASCLACDPGYYLLNSTTCSPCSITDCVDCSSPTTCTLCANTFSLSAGSCICDTTLGIFRNSSNLCVSCTDLHPNCVDCAYGALPSGVNCANCTTGFFSNGGICTYCITGCATCNSTIDCMVCIAPSYVLNLITYQCDCNAALDYFFNGTACEECALFECFACTNLTVCATCYTGFYLNSSLQCVPIICGDNLISVGETCDDGNSVGGDGCSASCLVEMFHVCSGTPSVCSRSAAMNISLTDMVTVVGECNRLTLSFSIDPYFSSFDGADFTGFMHVTNEPNLKLQSWVYLQGSVTYNFELLGHVQDRNVTFMFLPTSLGVADSANYTYSFLSFVIAPNVKAYYYPPEDCASLETAQTAVTVMQYASYATMFVSILPCKIVGLEMIGVLQLSFFTVGSVDTPNLMMRPLLALKSVNGFNLDLGSESARRRLLTDGQLSGNRLLAAAPTRIQNLSYSSNFLRNCNVMLGVVSAILIVSAILYSFAFCFQHCAPCLWSFSRRAIKEVLLTLVLFNCFNFAYSAGLHFAYAPREDALYLLGTLAAVGALLVMVGIGVGLMVAEEEGYGEYKEKLKVGCVEKGYFVVTIVYRMGLGLYLSSANEDELSTLLVLGFSILWLLYNLVNLPFRKAYHNYRANLCHLTQFVCLFVSMYYRSMKSTADPAAVSAIYAPLYLEYVCISLSLVVSLIVLFYEIYLFITQCCRKDTPEASEEHRERKESEANLNDPDETLGNIDNPVNGIMISQNFSQDYDEYK